MKKFINNKTDALKGVSTLDVMKRNLRIILPLLVIIVLSGVIYGGHSILDAVDPSFDPQIQTNSFSNKQVSVIMPLSNGKILAAGRFNSYNRQPVGGIVRLNPDATLDATFTPVSFANYTYLNKIIIQPDGKLILRGLNMLLNGQTGQGKNVLRLNSNGTLDTTFDYKLSGVVYDVAVDASGRTVLSGFIKDDNSVTRSVVRLNSDGSQDTSFQFDTAVPISAVRVAAQGNKVIVGFQRSSQLIKRLNENGTIDGAFNIKTVDNSQFQSINVQSDGKILALTSDNLYRLNENGSDDGGFTTINFPNSAPARNLALSDDGKIIVSSGLSAFEIKRYLSSGSIDGSFVPYIMREGYSSHGVLSDGSVIIGDANNAGISTNIPNYFSRLYPNGTLDTTFNAGGIGFQSTNPGSIRTIAVQTDGKILIGGKFDMVNDSVQFKIARLNADSSLDTTFQFSTYGANIFTQIIDIFNIKVQPDGKILVSGSFTYLGGLQSNLIRLNADGGIDRTFNTNLYISEFFTCCGGGQNKIAVLGDGKIIVGTSRNQPSQLPFPIKLNADGTRDTAFNPTIYAAQNLLYIYDLAVQPDGKIIIGGRHDDNSGAPNAFIARLNPDGSADQTFSINEEKGRTVSALAVLPNGKILFAKSSPYPSPVKRSDVLRLNSDGSLDNTFNAGTGANDKINTILALPTGKIFIGGRFTEFNKQTRQNLVQLNADGSVEPMNYTLNDEVLSLAVDGEGRILVGGSFTIINAGGGNTNRSYVARLIDSTRSIRKTRFDFDGDGRADIAVYRASEGNWFINQSSQGFTASTFGARTDRLVPADYDGDGKTDIAVYRAGIWYILNSASGFSAVQFGESTDIPQPADYDGDGRADIAVFRPSNGTWYVLGSRDGFYAGQFGANGDKPVAADYDGDGKADFAVFRNGNWYLQNSAAGFKAVQFGFGTDVPVPADYDGDGKTDIAVFRDGFWYILESNGGFRGLQFGNPTDLPVTADYDGDGKTDIAVYRAGIWYLLKSSNNGFYAEQFGNPNDQPIPSALRQIFYD